MPILGTGFVPSLFALTLLALPPILINTCTAMRQVDPDMVDAARGMGMTRAQIMRRVELPIAMPVIFAGIRTASVQVVSGAVLAAYIGGGGLGDFITAGIAMMAMPQLLVGAIPATLLAIGADRLFGYLQTVADAPRDARAMIEIRDLVKRFAGTARPAVDHLSLTIPEGEVCVLIGPSGCGKTTTMRIINRMIEPDGGSVTVARPRRDADRPGEPAPQHRLRDPAGRPLPALDDRRQHRDRAASCWAGTRPASRRASTNCWSWSAWSPRSIATAFRASFRAGRNSASASRARLPPTRRSC